MPRRTYIGVDFKRKRWVAVRAASFTEASEKTARELDASYDIVLPLHWIDKLHKIAREHEKTKQRKGKV